MAHGAVFTWAWAIVGVAAVLGGLLTAFGARQQPALGAMWIGLGVLNLWGAWRHRSLSRGRRAPR